MAEVLFGDSQKARRWLSKAKARFLGDPPCVALHQSGHAPGGRDANSSSGRGGILIVWGSAVDGITIHGGRKARLGWPAAARLSALLTRYRGRWGEYRLSTRGVYRGFKSVVVRDARHPR